MTNAQFRRKIVVSSSGEINISNEKLTDPKEIMSEDAGQEAISLYFFPDYTTTNPYQDLLYSNLPVGFKAEYGTIDDAVRASHDRKSVVFHLHWPEPLFAKFASVDDFAFLSAVFFEKLTLLQRNGGAFVVTVHNAFPHDKGFETMWLDFYQQVLSVADRIHIHSKAALSTLLGLYDFDASKTFVLPHGNYEGVYSNEVAQSEARAKLSLESEAVVYGFVGQLRPYKGLAKLVDAFREARALIPKSHLLIAGKPVHPVKPGYWKAIAQAQPSISVFEGYISDHYLQNYFMAADVIVLPYTEILTSGSVMLAASFGKPIIFPDLETLIEEKEAGLGIVYDHRQPDGLLSALIEFSAATPEMKASFATKSKQFSESRGWQRISKALGKELSELWPFQEQSHILAGHDVVLSMPQHIDAAGSIGIAVVSYHSADDISDMILGLKDAAAGRKIVLFILDNSEDGSDAEALRRLSKDAILIKTNRNLGYAGGNNVILEFMSELGCAYAMIVNPDIRFEQGVLDRLADTVEQFPGAVLSPLVCKNENLVSFAGGYVQRRGDVCVSHFLDGHNIADAPSQPYSADVLNGCAIFAPLNVFEQMGPIPESYFLYFEETDWFLGAKERGIKCIVVPGARVHHAKRSHGKLVPSLYYLYYRTRSTFLMNAKFGGASEVVLRRLTSGFVKPWREKLTKDQSGFLALFDRVMAVAIEDGQMLKEGPIDIGDRMDEWRSGARTEDVPGFVEHFDEELIGGWITTSGSSGENPAANMSVWLIVDDVPLEEKPVDVMPDDLSGARASTRGFYFQTPREVLDGGVHKIEVRFSTDGTRIPFRTGTAKYYKRKEIIVSSADVHARIDGIRDGKLIGWARDKVMENRTVYFDIEINGERLRNVPANLPREDLVRAGFGNGKRGFEISLPSAILANEEISAAVFKNNSDTKLREGKWKAPLGNFSVKFDNSDYLRWAYLWFETPPGAYHRSTSIQNFFARNRRYYSSCQSSSEERLVSVIMPAFNRASLIEDSIQSVFTQSYKNWELLVVDDGSSDGTGEFVESIIEKTKDDRIKLIRLDKNSGVANARNVGLEQAHGEFIAYLDSDNQWYPDCLKVLVTALEENSDYECAYAGQEIWEVLSHFEITELRAVRACPFNRSKLERRNFIDLNVFVHRRSTYERLGGFNTEMTRLVDWDLILKYTKERAAHFVPVLVNKYFVALASNQITVVEKHKENLIKLMKSHSLEIGDFH